MDADTIKLQKSLKKTWGKKPTEKVNRYIGQFHERTKLETRISGKVQGNHGIYTVTIQLKEGHLSSACSCYIGKHGYCHHCEALAKTYLEYPESFQELETRKIEEVNNLQDLELYLQSETLDSLLKKLKKKGITQKAFAESIGMSSRKLSSIKSSELRNRFYNELGSTKLAVLWVMEHIANGEKKTKRQ
jgi:uncharacterized Zn finger protein